MIGFKKRAARTAKGENRDPRRGIFLWAFLISLICGVIEFGEPLEDVIQTARNGARAYNVKTDIVVVGIDDRSVLQLGGLDPPRDKDAQVIDALFAMGAKRVFFDRAYANPTNARDDALFAAALARHKGKIFLGTMQPRDPVTRKYTEIRPRPEFLKVTEVTSLNGKTSPFGLSARLPFNGELKGEPVPSMSSMLSGRFVDSADFYRPDWAMRIRSIPTVSFLDVADGVVKREAVAGKDMVVGSTASSSSDLHRILGQGWMPGVYFHVVGAETLRQGVPSHWGWIPGFLVGLALSVWHLLTRRKTVVWLTFAAAIVLLGFFPIYLDAQQITVDVVPGMLLFTIIGYRAMTLRRVEQSSRTNIVSGLPNLAALRDAGDKQPATLIALKMRNYAEIAASFDELVERAVVDEICRRIALSGDEGQIYHSEDTLLWLTATPMGENLAHHLEGLKALLSSALILRQREIDMSVAFGVDADHERPMNSRIGSAMLCAEEAARSGDIWKFYDPQRLHEAAWQLSLLSSLDEAVDNGEVWVAYQPKLDIRTNEIIGAEALARWSHPERGAIGPDEFIGVAEKHNRIEKLTAFVLDQAVAAAAKINAEGRDFAIAVNLSVQLLQKPDLLEFVDRALARHNLPPEKLILEVTETGKLDRNGRSIAMMRALVDRGIRVSIDDYGTGNATLDYLKILPSHEVKIDRQFVANIDSNAEDRILVGSTIEMVHSLGRKVVAEGVETAAELQALRLLGCDTAQGYFVSHPLRLTDLNRTLAEGAQRRGAV